MFDNRVIDKLTTYVTKRKKNNKCLLWKRRVQQWKRNKLNNDQFDQNASCSEQNCSDSLESNQKLKSSRLVAACP